MTTDLLYQAEVPAVAGIAACLRAGVSVSGGTLRVDEHVAGGDLTSPMCLVTSAGPGWSRSSMADVPDLVQVRALVTCIGTSVQLVTELRAKCVRAVTGRDPATREHYTPLTVTGLVVVRRGLSEESLPGVTQGGGWANAVLPISLMMQPES